MNLVEFVRQNDIKSVDGGDFDHSPEFAKMRQFEQTCHTIRGVLFVEPETYAFRQFDVVLRGSVQEKWDRRERKNNRQFFIDRTFRYPGLSEGLESIEDAVPAGKTVDEAMASLEADRERFDFFKRYDLIDAGRYWLNRDLKRCFVEDGRVIAINPEGDGHD